MPKFSCTRLKAAAHFYAARIGELCEDLSKIDGQNAVDAGWTERDRTFVEPLFIAEIAFHDVTSDGLGRLSFKKMREDKAHARNRPEENDATDSSNFTRAGFLNEPQELTALTKRNWRF